MAGGSAIPLTPTLSPCGEREPVGRLNPVAAPRPAWCRLRSPPLPPGEGWGEGPASGRVRSLWSVQDLQATLDFAPQARVARTFSQEPGAALRKPRWRTARARTCAPGGRGVGRWGPASGRVGFGAQPRLR